MEFREMTRNAYCRGCDKLIERNTEKAITFYSFRNRGQHIHICKKCVDKMKEMVDNV